jgi:hypothetical protein
MLFVCAQPGTASDSLWSVALLFTDKYQWRALPKFSGLADSASPREDCTTGSRKPLENCRGLGGPFNDVCACCLTAVLRCADVLEAEARRTQHM